MKRSLLILTVILINLALFAQEKEEDNRSDFARYTPKQESNTDKMKQQDAQYGGSRIFYGGSLGLSFGSYTTVRVNPLVGYRLTPKFSAGITALYEYSAYTTSYGKQNYNNFGGSLFGRFRFIPQLYAHAEFNYTNYEYSNRYNEKYRLGVPFVLLGGGFSQRVAGNTYAYGQILFDVLMDENSPYADWTPFYSVGVSVGF